MTQPQQPPWMTMLQKGAPSLLADSNKLRESIMAEGALSVKVKTLMTLICDALLAHPEGCAGIANRARALGATEEEIAETVAVAYLMGGTPAMVTAAEAFRG